MSEFKMAMSSLDPRTGGACANVFAKKCYSYIVGYVHLILWISSFFILVFNPSSVSDTVKNADTTTKVFTGFVILFCIIFSVVLLLGLHKGRRLYIKAYCIYVMAYLVLLAIGLIVNIKQQIAHQTPRTGFRFYISWVFSVLMNLFSFFVVRCYYLVKYCNGHNQLAAN